MPLHHFPHHRNRGNGIGSVLRSLSNVVKPMFHAAKRNILPLAKKAGKELKSEGISFLKETGKDLLAGNDLKSSLKKNIRKSKRKIIRKVKRKVGGKKNKTGSGGKRRKKRKGGGKIKKGNGRKRNGTGKRKKTTKRKKNSIFDGY